MSVLLDAEVVEGVDLAGSLDVGVQLDAPILEGVILAGEVTDEGDDA